MKFPYDMPFLPGSSPPERWDVVVFRYPEEPEVSYIKRLVGLPGEELRVYFGDVYIKPSADKPYEIARKPLRHQRAMQVMVYDDNHHASALVDHPEWRRWGVVSPAGGWAVDSEKTSPSHYTSRPGLLKKPKEPGAWAELRYRHLVPDPEQWDAIVNRRDLPRPPRSTLVTDFYSYNTNLTAESSSLIDYPRGEQENAWMQPHWVGDLSLSLRLKVNEPGGKVRLELVEGGILNHCEIDLATGRVAMRHGDKLLAERSSPIKGPGDYRVEFANVDDRLTLLVDGDAVFGDGVPYETLENHPAPTAADLSPAAVATMGASIEASDLVLKRDIYYTLYPGRPDYINSWEKGLPRTPVELFEILGDPEQFPSLGGLRWHDYPIGPDRFLMLGVNSPRSKDSRGWDNRDRYDPDYPDIGWDTTNRASWEVPRSLLTGKAFYVYWPHGKPFGPDIRIKRDFQVPFLPYFSRMKWIR